ncbi:MAG: peptidylprolyl isomerase [Rhodothermaceae bacterium]|nr:peptidylprolyl isomerase [Rhodothermaceae bacterium]
MYDIVTTVGTMRMRLYNETPVHRDNFRKLVGERFFDGTTFHRVINNFMIQGGDPNSRDGNPRNDGQGGPPYTLPAEIIPTLYHKRGAIAAARQPDRYNPSRSSNGSQFYIVKGQVFDEATLLEIEDYLKRQLGDPSFIFSNSARNMYTSQGGYPMLDNQYTIFGELVEGYDVLDAISAVQTDGSDRPVEDITIISIRPSRAQ